MRVQVERVAIIEVGGVPNGSPLEAWPHRTSRNHPHLHHLHRPCTSRSSRIGAATTARFDAIASPIGRRGRGLLALHARSRSTGSAGPSEAAAIDTRSYGKPASTPIDSRALKRNNGFALRMPVDPMYYNYHVLAAQMYAHELARRSRELATERNRSRRLWLQQRIDRARINTTWHHERALSGAAVPEEVAALAKKAWRLRASAHKAESTEKRTRQWEKYRLVMRAAGHALKEHFRSLASEAVGTEASAVQHEGQTSFHVLAASQLRG